MLSTSFNRVVIILIFISQFFFQTFPYAYSFLTKPYYFIISLSLNRVQDIPKFLKRTYRVGTYRDFRFVGNANLNTFEKI